MSSNNKVNVTGIDAGTIARTVALALALTNQVLTMGNKGIIPIDDADLNNFVTLGLTIGTALVAWWKNNSVTEHAQTADSYLQSLKFGEAVKEGI